MLHQTSAARAAPIPKAKGKWNEIKEIFNSKNNPCPPPTHLEMLPPGSLENSSEIAALMTFLPYPTKKTSKNGHSLIDYPCCLSLTAKKGKVTRKRATRLSAVQMLEKKNERKADLKEKELKLKSEELELQKKKV